MKRFLAVIVLAVVASVCGCKSYNPRIIVVKDGVWCSNSAPILASNNGSILGYYSVVSGTSGGVRRWVYELEDAGK